MVEHNLNKTKNKKQKNEKQPTKHSGNWKKKN
jgi:hypothetical protein